jgi:hypothetical protein
MLKVFARLVLAITLLALSREWAGATDPALSALARLIVTTTTEDDPAPVVAHFDPAFAKAYKKASSRTEDSVLDFDWMTNSQDPDVEAIEKTIDARIDQISDAEATIKITFMQEGRETAIDYLARKVEAKWVLTDVTYPSESFSLRDLVSQ